jgi:hypothetical protein
MNADKKIRKRGDLFSGGVANLTNRFNNGLEILPES